MDASSVQQNQIFCKDHPKYKIKYLKLTKDKNQILKCEECALEEGQIQNYLSLKTINICDEDYIFTNFPPLDDSRLLKNIKKMIQEDTSIVEYIEKQFTQLVEQTVQKIFKIKKEVIQLFAEESQKKKELIKIYNQISGKEKLKQLINTYSLPNEIENLSKLISNALQQKSENTQILTQQLQILQDKSTFSQQEFTNFQKSLYEQIESYSNFIIQTKSQLLQMYDKVSYCSYDQSNEIEVLKNINNNSISICKKNGRLYGGMYFKYELNKQKIYKFRFRLNDEAGKYFIIGLLNQNKLSRQLDFSNQGKIFCQCNQSCGGKVVKGSYFYQIKKNQIIEMTVNIKNQQIQFADYPEYNNINELIDGCKLDQDNIYYLAIHFGINEDYQTCIDLIHFEEIDN